MKAQNKIGLAAYGNLGKGAEIAVAPKHGYGTYSGFIFAADH